MNRLLCFIGVLFLSTMTVSAQTRNSKTITLDIDFMEGFQLKQPASQIILGNPIIADITVRDDQYIFISGKSPGRTNMLVYGRDGKIAEKYILAVRDPDVYLTVYKGTESKAHFDCEPLCQRVLRIEDSNSEADTQRSKVEAQIQMIDGRSQQAKSEEAAEQQEVKSTQ